MMVFWLSPSSRAILEYGRAREAVMSEGRPDRPQLTAFNRYDLKDHLARLRGDAPLARNGRDSFTLVRDPGLHAPAGSPESGNRSAEPHGP